MTRKLLIVVFSLAIAGNAIAAVALNIEADAGCGGCCRNACHSERRASQSRLRCLMQCDPEENQRMPELPVLKTVRYGKEVVPVTVEVSVIDSTRYSRSPHSIPHSAFAPIHIYLSTGALLI